MTDATYALEVDLDNDGTFEEDEDLTADVTADAGSPLLVTERGHDLTRVLSPPLAGAASFVLDNAGGDYSPGGTLKAGREMRFRVTFDGTEYDVWRGFLDHPVQTPPGGTIKRVAVQCFGNLARLAGRTVSTELYSDIKTGAAIGHLLDAAGFPAGLRDIDTGETTLSWWWLDNEDALSALEVLKNSEGPGAALYEDGAGKIVFKGRYARNTEANSTTVQTTFNSGDGDEPRIGLPFAYVPGIKDVVNVCIIDAVSREAQTLAEVWALGETVTLAPNETKKFVARNSSGDPFQDAVAPTTGDGDYTVSSGSVSSVTLDRDSGASVTISITGGASGAEVTGLRLRAKLVTVQNSSSLTNTIDTSTSQSEFGERPYRLRVRPEIGVNVAQDFANAVVGFYKDGLPITTLVLHDNKADERMTAALAREVGDRVRVVVGDELDEEMYVEHIRHEIMMKGYQRTTFGLIQAQGNVSYFTLDESVLDGDDVLAF